MPLPPVSQNNSLYETLHPLTLVSANTKGSDVLLIGGTVIGQTYNKNTKYLVHLLACYLYLQSISVVSNTALATRVQSVCPRVRPQMFLSTA